MPWKPECWGLELSRVLFRSRWEGTGTLESDRPRFVYPDLPLINDVVFGSAQFSETQYSNL